MLIELKEAPDRLLVLAGRAATKGKTRSSVPAPVGATPPDQFAPVPQLASAPLPVQVKLAGARRSSSASRRGVQVRLRIGFRLGRDRERNQRDQLKKAMRNLSMGGVCPI